MSEKPIPTNWLQSGEYLPDFMRDFHDQKDLFKAMQEVVERSNAKHPGHRAIDLTWTTAHIYTVDIFLWVMARHGYTLQRSRKPLAFSDIHQFIGAATEREKAASTALLQVFFAKATAPISEGE